MDVRHRLIEAIIALVVFGASSATPAFSNLLHLVPKSVLGVMKKTKAVERLKDLSKSDYLLR
jgi:hypothetical protein